MDAITTFLQGDFDEKINIEQPKIIDDGSEKVFGLKKVMVGHKRTGRQWNIKLNAIEIRFGSKNRRQILEFIMIIK